jgi:hypothetical protein
MKLSTLVIIFGGLLSATTIKWSKIWDRRTISQVYQDIKAGKQRATVYERIVAPLSLTLIVIGMYLALTWR